MLRALNLCAAALAVIALPSGEAAIAADLALTPCRIDAGNQLPTAKAECGRMTVPEDPANPAGNTIELAIALVPALSVVPEPDPIVFFAGGPGQGAVETYLQVRGAFEPLRQDRPILLVDQRGTGGSNKLSCPELNDEDFGQEFDATVVRRLTRECLDQLPGDPRFYTTSVAVQDLHAVRAALGFDQLNLWGGSYGTRVALHYLKRYPDHVRSVIIDGVAPSDDVLGPDIAIDAQQSVAAAFDRCAESPACAAQYGDLGATLRSLRARLAAEPVEATVLHPRTGALETETMTDELLAAVVRLGAYKPLTRALLPTLIQRAHDGDYTMLASQGLLLADSFADAMAAGMHNAVVCTEDAPYFPDDAAAGLEETFMGRFQLDYLVAMCEVWPAGVIDDDFKEPVTSDKPVLILSGEYDPVTPPANGEAALATLSNARHLVAAQQGHIVTGVGCMPRLLDEFVTTLDVDALDASCLDRVGGMPFFLNAIGPTP